MLISAALPDQIPIPEARPDTDRAAGGKPTDNKAEAPQPEALGESAQEPSAADASPPIEEEDPPTHVLCMAELKALGVEFIQADRIDDGGGCGIASPLGVTSVGGGVKLSPPGTLRCTAAVNLARWTRDIVIPMLKQTRPEEKLAEINQASTYICRKRNNSSGKISQHAHGTAVDIAGFTFQSGRTFSILPRQEDSTLNGAFQRAIGTAACLYFTTVLDPGSDKAHETHLHLDTLERKGGYRYCW